MMSLGIFLHLNKNHKTPFGRFPISLWLLVNSAFMRNFGEVSRAQEISCCDKNQTLKWDGPPKLPKCIQPPQLRAVICNISPFNRRLRTHQQSILRSIENTPQPFGYQYTLQSNLCPSCASPPTNCDIIWVASWSVNSLDRYSCPLVYASSWLVMKNKPFFRC